MKLQITDRDNLLAEAEVETLQRRYAFQMSRFEQLIRNAKADLRPFGDNRVLCEMAVSAQGFKLIRAAEIEDDATKAVSRALDRAQRTLQRSLDMRQLFSATAEVDSLSVRRQDPQGNESNVVETNSRKAKQ
ncbi:MAG: hypothetical protein ACE361_27315 [Aureliella sp.]